MLAFAHFIGLQAGARCFFVQGSVFSFLSSQSAFFVIGFVFSYIFPQGGQLLAWHHKRGDQAKKNLIHQNQKSIFRFYIKFPGEETNWLTFVQPFSANLWVVLGSFLAMVSTLLKVSYLFGCEKNPESFTVGSSLIVIWGSWLLQGSSVDPKSIPSRIIILFSFFFGLIIYTAYSAKLISFLSVSKPSLPFSTMENLLETRQYSVGLTRGSAFYSLFFEAPPGSLYKRVAEELVAEDDLVDSMAQGVDRTLRNKYAFVWDTISMPERDGCQILEIPLDLDSNIVAMAWNSRLPHRHILHHFFDKIRESGQLFTFTVYFHFLLSRSTFSFYFHFLLSLSTFTFYLPQSGQLSRILRTHMPETKTNCWGEGEFKSMGLNNTIAAFGLVAAAVLLAFLTFMLELLVSRLTAK